MSQNPIPQGKYKPAVRHGDLIFTAGMSPPQKWRTADVRQDHPGPSPGRLPGSGSFRPASNALTAAQNTLKEGERIVQILSLTVYLNASPDYTTHAKVGDIASNWLYEQLGEAGIGPRAAIGLATLPGNAPVEIQLVAAAG